MFLVTGTFLLNSIESPERRLHFKEEKRALARWLSWWNIVLLSILQNVTGQDAHLDCGFDPRLYRRQSNNISVCFSLKSIHIPSGEDFKKKKKRKNGTDKMC